MKIPTLLAYQAEAGAVLPKQNPFGTTHRIVEVTFPDDSTDVRIKTTHGEWDFGLEDPLVFPRRQDGSTIDWTAQEDEYPTPLEVRVGDLLRPESTSMPNPHRSGVMSLSEQSRTFALRNWRLQCRRVTAITAHPNSLELIDVIMAVGQDIRRYTFHKAERIGMQRTATIDRARTAAMSYARATSKSSRPPTFGPYQRDDTEELVMIAVHPTGRGRWPREITLERMLDVNGLKIVRTPSSWVGITYLGEDKYGRHPKDPAWGVVGPQPLPE